MYCKKCGKEIFDEAVVCPHCGCSTENYQTSSNNNVSDADYPKFQAYKEKVNSAFILAIISLVTCLGIGIIFELIWLFTFRKLTVPNIKLKNPRNIAEFESTQRKFKNANIIWSVAWLISWLIIIIAFVSWIFVSSY